MTLTDPAAPGQAPLEVRQAAAVVTGPAANAPVRRNSGLTALGIVGIAIAALLALAVVAYLIAGLGPVAFGVGGIMALVPLAIVFFGVHWIDRWEPEPRGILVFAFLWGAGASVAVALIVGAQLTGVISAITSDVGAGEFLSAVVEAPLVEEGAKALGLLLIFLFARKHFDGPIDGLVYAAWVAGGFAFTENILYFGVQLLTVGTLDGGLAEIFLARGLMSPFAHVMFTACTGIALGFAARRTNAVAAVGVLLLGLVPAVLLHAFWNGSLYFVSDFYAYYAVVQFPLFAGGVLIVLFLRRQEAALTHERLSEYAAVGWFNRDEVNSLATGAGRRRAQSWANRRGLGAVMRRYTRDATRLAFTRQRIVTGRASIGAEADEAALLAAIVASRAALVSSAPR
ncbi:RsiW-degrading membrane proteinase PrsW (M82 family) [Conyzicola lurida]|uniref:RsiW-degrading membrane proteinase PrsW (M82 family) n=1 Tax=Conyzicola lurida TaxID=1172621 RepID=A0A841AHP7_9MICO|nr:PrsW family intramembrane metalloprotease [Conyzicola lurida]MBB5842757.1 RsiW-degrading membrane proteinase PrsW (M82 family) [Conyzicola lurida]